MPPLLIRHLPWRPPLPPRRLPRSSRRFIYIKPPSTPQSTPPAPITTTGSDSSKHLSRLQRINARLPRFLQRWTTPLLRAPASQIVAFLLLHEATAVVPLFGLVGVMHYTNWLPPMAESAWVVYGVEKFGKYARRKGWLVDEEVRDAEERVEKRRAEGRVEGEDGKNKRAWASEYWAKMKATWQKRETVYSRGEAGVRWLVEFATAWAVVKALIVPRLALSVWATPWFARIAVEPIAKAVARRGGRLFGGKKVQGAVIKPDAGRIG